MKKQEISAETVQLLNEELSQLVDELIYESDITYNLMDGIKNLIEHPDIYSCGDSFRDELIALLDAACQARKKDAHNE